MNTVMIWQTRTTDSKDTEKLGEQLGRLIKNHQVVELRSDLGGGKTTFARGLAKGLGCSGAIVSPTFTLSREYQCTGGLKLYHFDFYRLPEAGIVAGQLAEALENPKSVVVVEWSDIVKDVLPAARLIIKFTPAVDNADEREISVSYPEAQAGMVRQLEAERAGAQP